MIWFKTSWEWLKKNWKYVVTFGIPVLLSFVMGILRSNRSLENKVKLKEKELKLKDDLRDLENKLDSEAASELSSDLADAQRNHDQKLKEIAETKDKNLDSINSAEEATKAIKDALK